MPKKESRPSKRHVGSVPNKARGHSLELKAAAVNEGDLTLSSFRPQEARLTAEERKKLLSTAHLLKRLGVDPGRLLEEQFIAEVGYRILQEKDGASVPEILRRMVNSPLANSPDALDAPSVRTHLKRARSWRKHVGERRGSNSGVSYARDLDACAQALGLARSRGGQAKPLNELLVDQLDYWTLIEFQKHFAERTGALAPKLKELPKELRTSEVAALWALLEGAGMLSSQAFESALCRQVAFFEKEKGTPGRLSPAERCELALWEFKVGRPTTDEDVSDAHTYAQRLRRDVQLFKARAKSKVPSKT